MQIRATANFTTETKSWQRGETGECSPEQAQRLIADGIAEEVVSETAAVKAPETAMKKRAPARTIGKPRAQE